MWSLLVESGKHSGRRIKLATERVVIGRAEDAQLRVASEDVSQYHCELLLTAQGVRVNDLDSRNGTQVNGETISTEFLLAPGNTLTVGPMSFRLLAKSAEEQHPEDEGFTDDVISEWLTDDIESLQSDTTVIDGAGGSHAGTGDEPAEGEPRVPPPSKTEFDSVAEEAADIIRRHREMIAAIEADEAGDGSAQ